MSKKNTVLVIGINFFPEPTGIGKYTGEFAFSLADKRYGVDVITSFPYYPQWKISGGYKNTWYKKEEVKGVSVTRCPLYVPGSLSGLKRMMQDFSFFLSALGCLLGKMISGKSYSMVFVSSPSFMSGFLGLFYCFFYRKTKFIYHIQDLQVDAAEELGMIKNPSLLKLLKGAEGAILKGADWVTTISHGMQQKISTKPYKIKNKYIFPNWVDFGSIYKKPPDKNKLAHLGFPLNKRLCFYSGAVGEKQGLEMVLDVAKLASAKLPDFVFVIAGSGPYVQVLKQKASNLELDNFFFIDLQPIDVFNELLNHAFLHLIIQKDKAGDLLLPSKLTNILAVEGVGIVTASPGTTLYNIVHANDLGVVIPPDNPDAFWTALVDISEAPETTALLKKNAGNYARRYLEKDTIIENFLTRVGLLHSMEADLKTVV